ncbi:MAG: AraC family transcriptional regulator ligand-binding domain-containing protein [Parvularculaceae bacterium]
MGGQSDLAKIRAPASYLRNALACLAPEASARRRVLARAGLTESDIDRPDGTMTVATQAALTDAFNDLIGPHWSIKAGPAWSAASQGALEVAMRSAETVYDALALVSRFGRVRGPQFDFQIRRLRHHMALRIGAAAPMGVDLFRPMCEAAVFSVKAVAELLLQHPPSEFSYEWAWPAPVYARELEAALGGPCRFGCAETRVIAPLEALAARSPYADRELHSTAVATLEAALAASEEASVSGRLAALFRKAGGDLPGADDAAQTLGMSRRTLARRLAEEGTNYREARDAALKEIAGKLIADESLSREAIAARLGFEDPTSFSRACKRWFGASMRGVRSKGPGDE